MAERAAERAAVARLAMTDLEHRLVQEWTAGANALVELQIALARHCADEERLALLSYEGKLANSVEIHDVLGCGEAHIEHRHERLAAGEKPRVLELAEQADHLRQRLRIVIGEARRLHSSRTPGRMAVGQCYLEAGDEAAWRTSRFAPLARRG